MMTVALKNAKEIKCSCGGEVFAKGVKLKELSRLLTGAEEDELFTIPTLYCIKYFKELIGYEEPPKEEIVLDFKR